MDAAAGFGLRHTLHPVDSRLEFQLGKHAAPGNGRDDFLEAARLPFTGRKHLDLPALCSSKSLVHAKQVAGKESRFRAARTRPDFKDCAFLVSGVLRQQQKLHVLFQGLDAHLRFRQFHFSKITHVAISRLIGQNGAQIYLFRHRLLIFADLGHDRLQLGIFRGELHIDVRGRTFGHARLYFAEAALKLAHFVDRKLRHRPEPRY